MQLTQFMHQFVGYAKPSGDFKPTTGIDFSLNELDYVEPL